MKILQINVTANIGSTGRIADGIGEIILSTDNESYIVYGRDFRQSKSKLYSIKSTIGMSIHGLITRLFDLHGFGSLFSTIKLLRIINKLNPDIIHLHNVHGYYLNIIILFKALKVLKIPVIWTLHDCWSFTGHCSHFTEAKCYKWIQGCSKCVQIHTYPKSIFIDNSSLNWKLKRKLFTNIDSLTLVPVSQWLAECVEKSFFKGSMIQPIYNGVNLKMFYPSFDSNIDTKYNLNNRFVAIAVASTWTQNKGLDYYLKLSSLLHYDEVLVLVGINKSELPVINDNIICIDKTDNIAELAKLYTRAGVCLNLSVEESFGLTTVEALACGTPGIVFDSTASPELISDDTGFVHDIGDLEGVVESLRLIKHQNKSHYSDACIKRVIEHYDANKQYLKYMDLYRNILNL